MTNINYPHPEDETIDRELLALRSSVGSVHGLGDAIRTMQTEPATGRRIALKWPIGIGSLAFAIVAVILVVSVGTPRAYAGELREIAVAQDRQQTMYEKAIVYAGSRAPRLVMEFWIDHNKEAYRQFSGGGNLQVARTSDGSRQFQYVAAELTESKSPYVKVEKDHTRHFSIDTVTATINSSLSRRQSIEKRSGVKLNGRTCDFYNLGNGYCRLWVDPATKLPLQREIYDRGVTLWERDVYRYAPSYPESTFEPRLQSPSQGPAVP